ncbi:GLPGLI family protein [Sphingobacterium sp. Mn56C]|uniref:GLPGLI family protein n=1 Tax=Sphingobacterium sp. Mn56C TaxID=3395261 RepID=UPI003BBC9DC6
MNRYILILLALCLSTLGKAQYAYFGTRGVIAFEKITFTKANAREMMRNWEKNNGQFGYMGGGGDFLNRIPESQTEKYILQFDENSTLSYLDKEDDKEKKDSNSARPSNTRNRNSGGNRQGAAAGQSLRFSTGGNAMPIGRSIRQSGSTKILFQDLKSGTGQVQIEIDDKYILSDTLHPITWRFTDEYRNIAGFECRRVNGATVDSLYLVAFYTEQIPVSAGPAFSFGLPGMILGLAIPEMHIQYWASKVDYNNEAVPKDWKDKKVKNMSLTEFTNSLGRYFNRGDNNSTRKSVLEHVLY